MSSLTDIIFLLLIFFMLTSSLVAPNALNLKLPGSSKTRLTKPTEVDKVRISKGGNFYLNGRRQDLGKLEQELSRIARSRSKPAITIDPDKGTPVEHVIAVMDLAMRYDINGVLATDVD